MSFRGEKEEVSEVRSPTNLVCEYTLNPLGIDVASPRFSWVLDHSERAQLQLAHRVLVASNRENLDAEDGDKWDSGEVASEESINVPYAGGPLESGKTYHWKVCVWDKNGKTSPWSKVATFEMGLLNPDDWRGRWIEGKCYGESTFSDPVHGTIKVPYGYLLRKDFSVGKDITQAKAYVSGLGYYELYINGDKIGDHVLDPGWTDYRKRILYSTYNITKYLRKGKNAIGIMLGNGRYIKGYGYGSPKVLLQLNIEFADDAGESIITDNTWRTIQGPVLSNDVYNGESYDARLEKTGWDVAGYDDSDWDEARVADEPGGKLVSQASFPAIKVVRIIQPLRITSPKSNIHIYDFGQNFTGWVRLCARGPGGTNVSLRYAELLNEDGTLNVGPNRAAKAIESFVLRGEGKEVYEPHFTYHGFRYVEVTGLPGTPTLESVEGRVVHSAVEPVGGFICSNSLINHIHRNVLWGQLSNLMSVPTDCPQRDERMGWMGDAQLSAEEAICNFDMAAFYTKWIEDIREAQREDGSVPDVVPPYWERYPADPAWGTACVVIPWYLYRYYGDKRILKKCYSGIKRWVDFLTSKATDYISYSKYGDWVPPGHTNSVDTPAELSSSWYYYHDALILSRIADILGRGSDAKKYSELSDKIKEAFNKRFLKDDCYATGSQTCNVLPLFLDMVPEDKKKAVLKSLIDDIVLIHGGHLNTGIVGTRYLLDVLTRYGEADLAYKIVTQTSYPSWGYMIREGATTMWERWEYLAGGKRLYRGLAGMNSHNHSAFCSVGAWFYKVLAGINTDLLGPGFRRITIKPYLVGDLRCVSASIETIRGMVSSNWIRQDSSLALNVGLPVNSQAKVSIPKIGLQSIMVKESKRIIWEKGSFIEGTAGVAGGSEDEGYVIFDVGSGSYSFEASKE